MSLEKNEQGKILLHIARVAIARALRAPGRESHGNCSSMLSD